METTSQKPADDSVIVWPRSGAWDHTTKKFTFDAASDCSTGSVGSAAIKCSGDENVYPGKIKIQVFL